MVPGLLGLLWEPPAAPLAQGGVGDHQESFTDLQGNRTNLPCQQGWRSRGESWLSQVQAPAKASPQAPAAPSA